MRLAEARFSRSRLQISDDSARPVGAAAVPAAHTESRDQYQDPERQGVDPDQPYEREQPGYRSYHGQDHPEEYGEAAADDHGPLAPYLLAQSDGHCYLGDTRDDGPGGDEVEKEDRGQPWQYEGDQAGEDTGQSFDEQQPAGRSPAGAPKHAHYREHAVDQGVGAEQQDQCLQCYPWAQERGQPEEYGDGATQRQSPPVSGFRR